MVVWTGGGWGCTNTVAVANNAINANSAGYANTAGSANALAGISSCPQTSYIAWNGQQWVCTASIASVQLNNVQSAVPAWLPVQFICNYAAYSEAMLYTLNNNANTEYIYSTAQNLMAIVANDGSWASMYQSGYSDCGQYANIQSFCAANSSRCYW